MAYYKSGQEKNPDAVEWTIRRPMKMIEKNRERGEYGYDGK